MKQEPESLENPLEDDLAGLAPVADWCEDAQPRLDFAAATTADFEETLRVPSPSHSQASDAGLWPAAERPTPEASSKQQAVAEALTPNPGMAALEVKALEANALVPEPGVTEASKESEPLKPTPEVSKQAETSKPAATALQVAVQAEASQPAPRQSINAEPLKPPALQVALQAEASQPTNRQSVQPSKPAATARQVALHAEGSESETPEPEPDMLPTDSEDEIVPAPATLPPKPLGRKAINARLYRLFKPRKNGEYLVSEEFVKMWLDKEGCGRDRVHSLFERSGYCPVFCL